jgi:hypothetical protein
MHKNHIIISLFVLCNLTLHTKSNHPTTIYCPGLGDSQYEIHGLIDQGLVKKPAKGIALKKENDAGLGHGIDIQTLKNNLDCKKNYILYGTSRGGSTAINYIAEHNPTNIQALILDATPSDMLNIVDEIQYKVGLFIFWTRAQKEWATQLLFPHYPKKSIPPIQAIANIQNKDLPVFIVHSHNDPIVNVRSAWENYKAFKQANFSHVYLCELQENGHMGNPSGPDSLVYKQALHSFYKLHGFQFDKKYANLSELDLAQFQPSLAKIDEKLVANQWKLRKQAIINAGIATAVAACIAAINIYRS